MFRSLGRIPVLLISMLVVGLLVLASCGPTAAPAATPTKPAAAPAATQPPAPATATTAPAPAKEYRLSFATGGTGGTYYPFGGAVAGVWSKVIPGVTVTVEATGGSIENVRLLDGKKADLAWSQNDVADYAYKGTEMFKDKALKITAVAATYQEVIQIVVPADSGIKGPADIKGKRVSVGPPGSGTEVNARQVLGAAGITYNDFGKLFNLSYAEAASHMKDRQIDVWMTTIGVPASSIQEVSVARPVNILPISGEWKKAVQSQYPFLVDAKVPAKTYNGQDTEVETVSVVALLVCREDLDVDLVYNLTKTLLEKADDIGVGHAKGKEITPETITRGITIPLHPGAKKYYEEKGLLK